MSRVSRLSEIRKRRAGGNGNDVKEGEITNVEDSVDGSVEQNDKKVKMNDEKVNEQTVEKNGVRQTQEVSGVKANQEENSGNHNDVQSSGEHIPNALDAEDQERLYRDIYNQTGMFEAEEIPAKAINYNSDLKDDLAPLYNRARHGTEKAINAVIQRKYQESLGH